MESYSNFPISFKILLIKLPDSARAHRIIPFLVQADVVRANKEGDSSLSTSTVGYQAYSS
jgi:hypothetical protein